MRPVLFSDFSPKKLLLWSAPLVWLGCGGGGTDVVLPALSITTSTGGIELDPDGYSLVVDGVQGQPIGLEATLTVERLSDGEHTIELAGVASNCVAEGENPRTVTVRAGSTTSVEFAVTCNATSGSIEVVTAISGPGTDPDGFALMLDGGDRGPIGVGGTVSLGGLAPGVHMLGLTGLAANCQVVGGNPRGVTVSAGQIAQVPFTVTCVAPGSATGTLDITTSTSGPDPDPDGYSLSLDGGASQPIGANARLTLPNVASSAHRVELLGLATNCAVTGANPLNVTITPGQTTTAAFAITCTPRPVGTGSVQVTVATTGSSLDTDGYSVTVDGGSPQTISVNGSLTVGSLTAGSHSVRLNGIAANCTVAGDNPRSVTITGEQTVTITFATTCVATGPALNLRIEALYVTQSTQRLTGDLPLVQDREGFIRVFVTANGVNTARPSVRVRFFRNAALVRTLVIPAASGSTPTEVQEGTLNRSWNVRVPAPLIQPGLAVLADVDPANQIAETSESDNGFPSSGIPQQLTVRAVPLAGVRFVPVLQSTNGLQGAVGNPDALMQQARRMYPLQAVQTDLHSVYTISGPLQPNDAINHQWSQLLNEIEALRVAENSSRTYYGVVKLDYSFGLVGTAFLGEPSSGSARAAVGWDNPFDAARVLAHELGHTWGQFHAPCGNVAPATIDPNFPYGPGIGVYGFDVAGGTLKPTSLPDIMGYCPNPWISDYTYQRVMVFRQSQPSGSAIAGVVQPSLLVWGRIENGRPVLEPSFEIMTRPSLPTRPGPYSIEATAIDGTRLFNLSFEAAAVADNPHSSRHFVFAVPLDQARASRLGQVRLTAPGAQVATMSQSAARVQQRAAPAEIVARREAGGVALKWNAAANPMVMVRDPDTGEVLSFARGGVAQVQTGKGEIDLDVSDGVRSHRVRLAINRR
jgi:hypothetical protein